MQVYPVHIVIKHALFTPEDADRARQQAGVDEHDFSWIPVARRLAEERMRARGAALGETAAEIVSCLEPPVRVGTVLLDNQPSDQGLRQRWLVRLLRDPGGFWEVPVPLQVEADSARRVPAARDELRQRLLAAIQPVRGTQ